MSWPIRSLTKVAPINARKPELFDGTRRYYSTGAVGKNGELDTPELVTFAERPSRANCMPKIGDVGFARMNGTQKVVLVSEAELGSLFSTGFCFLEPNDALDSKYLFYFLTSEGFQSEKNAFAGEGIMGGIKNSDVANIQIPLPPLLEQRRIVRLLDEAFKGLAIAKANAEKNQQNVRAVFESFLESVFTQGGEGWKETTLGEAFEVRDGTHDSPKYQLQGYPLVTSKNLRNDGLSLSDVRLISESDYININKRSAVHQGDVLFAMIGTIGNPTVVVEKPNFAIKNVALFKNPHGQNSAFLKYYLASRLVVNRMAKEAKGTTQKFVSLGYLREFPISIPPFVAQTNIVDRLDRLAVETQKLTTLYGLQSSALDAMKESLLRQSFYGSKRAA